jgi:hypothetical protein
MENPSIIKITRRIWEHEKGLLNVIRKVIEIQPPVRREGGGVAKVVALCRW